MSRGLTEKTKQRVHDKADAAHLLYKKEETALEGRDDISIYINSAYWVGQDLSNMMQVMR